MKLTLKGISSELISDTSEIESARSINELHKNLIESNAKLKQYVLKFAVNGQLSDADRKIGPEDEIIVFNPYPGG